MTSINSQPATGSQGISLLALLDSIERETASALQLDIERLRERYVKNQQVRALHISFVVGWHEMALPVNSMQEVGDMPTITPLPHLPSWIRGIVQIRGEILSVVDFQLLFRLRQERRGALKKSYILFSLDGFKCCLSVNRITGILNVDGQRGRLDACSAEEQTACPELLEFIKGVQVQDARRIFILDGPALAHTPKIRQWR
ncbi:MAG: hypothetical protein GX087_04405 [Desulfobulbaceae bacterium]|nr:hypothetical protein [Desulfobulbaceae bacterium]